VKTGRIATSALAVAIGASCTASAPDAPSGNPERSSATPTTAAPTGAPAPSGVHGTTGVDLVRIDPATGAATVLVELPGRQEHGERSPDGGLLAYQAKDDGGRNQIFVIDPSVEAPRQLTDLARGAREPAWSPDGATIAFTSPTSSGSDIFVMDADGGHVRRLAGTAGVDGGPDWSPDGRSIVFEVDGGEVGVTGIWRASFPGGSLTRLTWNDDMDGDSLPSWAPDGSWIAFIRYENSPGSAGNLEPDDSDIWLMRPDGSGQHRLLAGERPPPRFDAWQELPMGAWPGYAGDGHFQGRPVWSPDGRRIAVIGGHCECITVIGVASREVVRTPALDASYDDASWDGSGILASEPGWVG